MTNFRIERPATAEEFDELFDLRWRVLRAPWHQPRGSERDEHEESAEHVLVRTGEGALAGTGRLHRVNDTLAQVRYMAVEDAYRGRGLGSDIYRYLEQSARESGVKRIMVHARLPVVSFYQRLGFSITGDGPTLFNKVEHKVMEKQI